MSRQWLLRSARSSREERTDGREWNELELEENVHTTVPYRGGLSVKDSERA